MVRFCFLPAALSYLTLLAMGKVSALKNEERNLSLDSCDSYAIDFPFTMGRTILWTNGGGADSEWINVDNWMFSYLPGVHRFNKVVMAANDKATVHCPATYMKANVYLEMRTGATLDIRENLNIGDKFFLKTRAVATQSSQSIVTVGKRFYLAAMYDISDQAQLIVGSSVYVQRNGQLAINGDSSSVSAATNSEMHGWLTYKFGRSGAGTFVVNGDLTIGSTAKLTIDASSYSAGAAKMLLIKYTTSTGSFAPDNIDVTGLAEGLTFQIKSESDGLYLELSGEGPMTGNPTDTILSPAPSHTPSAYPSESPSESPSKSPSLPLSERPSARPVAFPSNRPSGSSDPPSFTPVTPSNSPSSSPIDPPVNSSTTEIVLSETGFDAITSAGVCPAEDTSALLIDGSAYTAGPAIITLFKCTTINDEFDLMKIKLKGFQAGLWFEIVYENGKIDLVIKSLDDYSGYWNRVKNSYVGDYPEQNSTEHFPDFSWGSVPRWISFRKNPNKEDFSENDIVSIATNNYISWYGLGKPEDVIAMAERIKDKAPINRKYKMLLYWNSESYWGSDISTFKEEWLLDGPGGTGGRPSYDHSIPEMREWWVDHAVKMDTDSAIDGVFTDNTVQSNPEKDNMIKSLAESLPANSLKMGNFLRQRFPDGYRWRMKEQDGSYFENQHFGPILQPEHESIIVSMQLAREASWKRKLVLWNGSRRNCGCVNIPAKDVPATCVGFMNIDEKPEELITKDLHLSLAEFLMVAEEFSYFSFNVSPDASCERWRWDSSSMPQFQRPLGKPLGPPVKVGHTFTRHFEHLSVKLNLDTEETTFNWLD